MASSSVLKHTAKFAGALRAEQLKTMSPMRKSYEKWCVRANYYGQIGLLTDDMHREENADVKEAVRRLPETLANERQFRLARAIVQSMKKTLLPKEEWLTVETDYPYLQPFLAEVRAEMKERQEWEAK